MSEVVVSDAGGGVVLFGIAISLAALTLFVALLVWAEFRAWQLGRCIWKGAATGLLALTVTAIGPWDSTFATWIAIGVLISCVGDVLMLGSGKRWMLAGLGTFLLAHVAYIVALMQMPGRLGPVILAAALAGLAAAGTLAWLLPHTRGFMRKAVVAYIATIAVMLAAAWSYGGGIAMAAVLALAATLFGISDLAVARQRFIKAEPWNKLLGLPTYYAAQALFIYAIA